ncbi:MAG TPA: shikimate kinase [Armatimonadaceae bacterium]|nr:shikimate kinase [Armatimonadaceae bacterium]
MDSVRKSRVVAAGADIPRAGDGDDTAALPLNIALIGFMGSGKSTVGRALARRLDWRYVDTDARIEAVAGCDIPALFARSGEAAFRDLETRILVGVSAGDGQVISTGGGAPLREENAAALRAAGLVVYLTARPDVIVARTERRAEERPLLAERGGKDLLAHVMGLLGERAPRYQRAAHLVVDTSERTPEAIAAEIVRKAGRWQQQSEHPGKQGAQQWTRQ